MSHLIKSFGRDEADVYCDWIDGAESCGEMNTCENRAEIILRLAMQELERLGYQPGIVEDYVEVKRHDAIYRICGHVGLAVISLGIFQPGEPGEDGVLASVEVYDDSAKALAEIIGKIPPHTSFPYRMIGRSYLTDDDLVPVFHCNFIGRIPVVSTGGRHCFFEGRLVAGGCDQDGNYCHFEIDDAAGFKEARQDGCMTIAIAQCVAQDWGQSSARD